MKTFEKEHTQNLIEKDTYKHKIAEQSLKEAKSKSKSKSKEKIKRNIAKKYEFENELLPAARYPEAE